MIGFQGEYGAFSEQAIYKTFGENESAKPCQSLDDVFSKVEKREVDCGVVPIENSIAGSIGATYDLLLQYDLYITGEIFLEIDHHLLGLPGTELADITEVYSHPQALQQCHEFLSQLEVSQNAYYDTAGSAQMLKEAGKPNYGAIASKVAADRYGLKVLAESIETNPSNETRFLVISREKDEEFSSDEFYKTSITFESEDEPGSLCKGLKIFAEDEINITMIQSRPSDIAAWKLRFYLDFEGHIDDPEISRTVEKFEDRVSSLQVLGSYPKRK